MAFIIIIGICIAGIICVFTKICKLPKLIFETIFTYKSTGAVKVYQTIKGSGNISYSACWEENNKYLFFKWTQQNWLRFTYYKKTKAITLKNYQDWNIISFDNYEDALNAINQELDYINRQELASTIVSYKEATKPLST